MRKMNCKNTGKSADKMRVPFDRFDICHMNDNRLVFLNMQFFL